MKGFTWYWYQAKYLFLCFYQRRLDKRISKVKRSKELVDKKIDALLIDWNS